MFMTLNVNLLQMVVIIALTGHCKLEMQTIKDDSICGYHLILFFFGRPKCNVAREAVFLKTQKIGYKVLVFHRQTSLGGTPNEAQTTLDY